MNNIIRFSILLFCFLLATTVGGQVKGVLWDKINNTSVPYASIFKIENGRPQATTSDATGAFSVRFSFKQLHILHIGYQPKDVDAVTDTIFLIPKEHLLSEVVVGNAEPEWIRPFLHRFITEKRKYYQMSGRTFAYNYQTGIISDTTGYWFENKGLLKAAPLQAPASYVIRPDTGIIHYKDSSAGCNFTNLCRIVYNDFVDRLDKKFIRCHLFSVSDDVTNNEKHIIQIHFRSPQAPDDDKGFIVVDTMKYVLLRVHRDTGLKYNRRHYTNAVTRAAFKLAAGYRYDDWLVSADTEYRERNGIYYPYSNKYKVYITCSSTLKNRNKCFESTEAELYLTPTEVAKDENFISLPHPWYMKIILSKKDRLQQKALQNIERQYMIY